MNHSKILWVLQLSNYTTDGKFILTADSNWQIFITKAAQIKRLAPDVRIDVLVPEESNCTENIEQLLEDASVSDTINPIRIPIVPNALVTRFDFPFTRMTEILEKKIPEYTHVYVNDPMLLHHYKALFYIKGKNAKPRWIVQTHFLDSPIARIVADDISYWIGTVEACTKADDCLWHCESMLKVFKTAVRRDFSSGIAYRAVAKSKVWKDGYSITEIRKPINHKNIRFNTNRLKDKIVMWVPNRVGGLGKSFDYTNNGKFLFEIAPKAFAENPDYFKNVVIVAGNPNQKITNDEIKEHCPPYMKLVDDALNRDEYRYISSRADIVVGMYTNDTNGGLASLEAIEHNAVPLFPDIYEYSVYFDAVKWPKEYRVNADLSYADIVMMNLVGACKSGAIEEHRKELQKFVRTYAAYEHTTQKMIKDLKII